MGCQKPSCLNAFNSPSLESFFKGSSSQVQKSLVIRSITEGSKTKNPPFIQNPSPFGFSMKLITFSLSNSKEPNLPGGFTAVIVAFFLETLPNPLLTRDQINLLHHDSVSAKGLVNLKKVVKNPASMETIVKNYL